MAKLSTYDISYIIKKYDPTTVREFKEFGLKLRKIGEGNGAFRQAYIIDGYNLVVKIPLLSSGKNIEHSIIEYKVCKRLGKLKRYNRVKKYLPNIYCCSKSGVILMDKYALLGRKGNASLKKEFGKLCDDVYDTLDNDGDIGFWNVGLTKRGALKIIDLGCFPEDL